MVLAAVLASFIALACILQTKGDDDSSVGSLPLVNEPGFLSLFSLKAKWKFIHASKDLVEEGQKLYPNKPFRLITDWGKVLMLTPKYAQEIRNDPHLSFTKAIYYDGHANIPGFETVKLISHPHSLIQIVARKYLTRHLSAVIRPLAEVTEGSLVLNLGSSSEWHEVNLKLAVLDIIARLSSRIYFGDQLHQNEKWLSIVKNYASLFFTAGSELRKVPWILRPVAHWFMPSCIALRSELRNARRLTRPYIEYRQKLKQTAIDDRTPIPQFDDVLQWAETEAQVKESKYDPATFQLTLSLLAIHTTYDLLEMCMIDLAKHPDYIPRIREEIVDVLRKDGWTKKALYNMKLLDSAIKESQRLKPGSITSMRRYATSDVYLSNGLVLKKGERLNVLTLHRSPDLYPSPDAYDAYRFFNLRQQAGNENSAQLVSTSVEHMGFGHGEHSCPGRFFAANEIKVALAHIIVKYDWKLVDEAGQHTELKGMIEKASGKVNIMVKRRTDTECPIDEY
ncbi:cytochrome P450 [Dothidotthia symphoricarpi CBS 119687]|uniref:Cytochrome P450 n=1 Tax=Dothidotthia symphoricarpi CBS 119687 TaxID=1392245 RepID=A0A6A6AB58_9PLEO|nr:cytochrome P450 [Dothidotthia symphoricarpi CBS 119687]KAF2129172.1 cytochrome P450 [Dothidotthia symphoricarpi CBS 119687]